MAKIIPLHKQNLHHSAIFSHENNRNIANDVGTQIIIDFDELFSELERNLNLLNHKNYQVLNCLETLEIQIEKTQKIADGIKSNLFD